MSPLERAHNLVPVPGTHILPTHAPGEPIDAPPHLWMACRSKWVDTVTRKTCVVVHCTGADNPARSTAGFFASCDPANDGGSTQCVADDDTMFQSVPDVAISYGAPPLNENGLHIEQRGEVAWSRSIWLEKIDTIHRTAYHVAGWCKANDIPVRLLRTADLPSDPAKTSGITFHEYVSAKWHQSTHDDPGPFYPEDIFMQAVELYWRGDDVALTSAQEDALAFIEANKANFTQLFAVTHGMAAAMQGAGSAPSDPAPNLAKAGYRLVKDLNLDEAGGHGSP